MTQTGPVNPVTVTYIGFGADLWPWSTDGADDACVLIAPGEPVFVHVRRGDQRIGGVWTPQPFCPTSAAALAQTVSDLLDKLDIAR